PQAGRVPGQPELRPRPPRASGEARRGDLHVLRALGRAVAAVQRAGAEQAPAGGSAQRSGLSNAWEQRKLLRLRIIEPAELPLQAVAPKKGQILAFALGGGLLLRLGLGLGRGDFDNALKS